MAEQLICNQQVDGSTPFTSSSSYGGIPERPKGADCKSVVTDFAGPNPASPTITKNRPLWSVFCLYHKIYCSSMEIIYYSSHSQKDILCAVNSARLFPDYKAPKSTPTGYLYHISPFFHILINGLIFL